MLCLPPLRSYGRYVGQSLHGLGREVRSDRLLQGLMLFFTLLYLPQAFIIIEDMGLITGFEVDPGSHMQAIIALLGRYNMHEGYHSRYYGWTFFALNFFLLQPVVLAKLVFGLGNTVYYLAVRLILFGVGLFSLVLFYLVLRRLFAPGWMAVAGGLLYCTAPSCFLFFYFIHPETTGTLFTLAGLLCLLNFRREPEDMRAFYLGIASLVLATLSKQFFLINGLGLLVLFYLALARREGAGAVGFLARKRLWQVVGSSLLLALGIAFVIHPFAFFEFKTFLAAQRELGGFTNGLYTQPLAETARQWLGVLRSMPLTQLSLGLVPLVLLGALVCRVRTKSDTALLLLVNAVGLLVSLAVIIYANRLFIINNYLQPLHPFLIINLLAVIAWLQRAPKGWQRVAGGVGTAYALLFLLAGNILTLLPPYLQRLDYRHSLAFQTYSYINQSIAPGKRMVFDQMVALPEARLGEGCHYWQGCGETATLEKFAPDYMIFNPAYSINNQPYAQTEVLKTYVAKYHFQPVAQFSAGEPVAGKAPDLIVFKRPAPGGIAPAPGIPAPGGR